MTGPNLSESERRRLTRAWLSTSHVPQDPGHPVFVAAEQIKADAYAAGLAARHPATAPETAGADQPSQRTKRGPVSPDPDRHGSSPGR